MTYNIDTYLFLLNKTMIPKIDLVNPLNEERQTIARKHIKYMSPT